MLTFGLSQVIKLGIRHPRRKKAEGGQGYLTENEYLDLYHAEMEDAPQKIYLSSFRKT